ncbi:hypothetical protein V5O48_018554 [Marasmius crinis-equi]|uniref:F-box domain-containing protein n=1 Tax=Marasmius crinis-equi TaxID=585013 RepID=A0ABR3EKU8_9AGAR
MCGLPQNFPGEIWAEVFDILDRDDLLTLMSCDVSSHNLVLPYYRQSVVLFDSRSLSKEVHFWSRGSVGRLDGNEGLAKGVRIVKLGQREGSGLPFDNAVLFNLLARFSCVSSLSIVGIDLPWGPLNKLLLGWYSLKKIDMSSFAPLMVEGTTCKNELPVAFTRVEHLSLISGDMWRFECGPFFAGAIARSEALLTLQININGCKELVKCVLARVRGTYPPLCRLKHLSLVVDKHSSTFVRSDWESLCLALAYLPSLIALDFQSFMCGFMLKFDSTRTAAVTLLGVRLVEGFLAAATREILHVESISVLDAGVDLETMVSLWGRWACSADVKFLRVAGLMGDVRGNDNRDGHRETSVLGVQFPYLEHLHLLWNPGEDDDVVYLFLEEHFDSLRSLKALNVFVESSECVVDMDYWVHKLRIHKSAILNFRIHPGWRWVREDIVSPWVEVLM